MAYIGNQPAESFTSFATQEFSTSATTSYTLDHAVTNENEIALFVNNVRQQPGSGKAYTATGTALTLSAATASTDTMYCVFLGRALQTVTPATNSITAAMVGNDLVSGKDALAAEPADTDEFLVSDAGTLKRIDYSLIKGGGITNAQQWRITTSFTGDADPISANWEEVDSDGYGRLGTTMASVSGIFTFPATGYWHIISTMTHIEGSTAFAYATNIIQTTENNSSYADAAVSYNEATTDGHYQTTSASFIFDVTDTTTHKIRIKTNSAHTSTTTMGDSDRNRTYVTFIRLGDT